MTEIVESKTEFRALAEEAIVAALRDPDPANPIAVEVARLIESYTRDVQAHVQRLGSIPPDILHIKARWPIEAVAMRLLTEEIREILARPAPPERA